MRNLPSPLVGVLSPFGRISGSGGGGADAYAIGGASPELVAAFTLASDGTTAGEYFRKASSETTFGDLFTHSVSGRTTMFDSTGTLVWAPHNFVPYSNDFTQGWSTVHATITTNAISAFGLNGIKLVSGDTDPYHELRDVLPVSSVPRRLRVIAKAAEWDWLFISHDGPNAHVYYDLTNGVVGAQNNGGVGEITSLGDGWYACDLITPNWTNGRNVFIRATNVNNNTSVTGDGVSGIYILSVNQWDDRLPMAESPDAPDAAIPWYVETTGTTEYLPRRNAYYYNAAWVKGGLRLESAAATNLHIYSSDFGQATWVKGRGGITSDAKLGLDGNTGNYLFTVNTTSVSGANCRDSNLTLLTAANHCHWGVFEAGASDWVLLYSYDGSSNQTWFDLSTGTVGTTTGTLGTGIEPLGGGKYLCWHYFLATTGSALPSFYVPTGDNTFACQLNDSIYCYHMQMEVGSVPSSPIITTGSTVTRAAETLRIPNTNHGLTTAGYSASIDMLYQSKVGGPRYLHFAGAAEQSLYRSGSTVFAFSGATGDQITDATSGLTLEYNAVHKIAGRWNTGANEVEVAANGVATTSPAPCATVDMSSASVWVGSLFGSSNTVSGFIREIRIWPGIDIGSSGIGEVTS